MEFKQTAQQTSEYIDELITNWQKQKDNKTTPESVCNIYIAAFNAVKQSILKE